MATKPARQKRNQSGKSINPNDGLADLLLKMATAIDADRKWLNGAVDVYLRSKATPGKSLLAEDIKDAGRLRIQRAEEIRDIAKDAHPTIAGALNHEATRLENGADDVPAELNKLAATVRAHKGPLPSIGKEEVAALVLMNNRHPALCTLDDFDNMSRGTASKAVGVLIEAKYAYRPRGDRDGATVTELGKQVAESLARVC